MCSQEGGWFDDHARADLEVVRLGELVEGLEEGLRREGVGQRLVLDRRETIVDVGEDGEARLELEQGEAREEDAHHHLRRLTVGR